MSHDDFEPIKIIEAFKKYMGHENKKITRKIFEQNLAEKMLSPEFTQDISPILAREVKWDITKAAEQVQNELLRLLTN